GGGQSGRGPSCSRYSIAGGRSARPHCRLMQGMLVKFALWLSQKLVAAALIVLVALAGYGLWLYLQEEVISEERRVEQIDRAMAERRRLLDAQNAIEERITTFRAEVREQK